MFTIFSSIEILLSEYGTVRHVTAIHIIIFIDSLLVSLLVFFVSTNTAEETTFERQTNKFTLELIIIEVLAAVKQYTSRIYPVLC